MWRKPVDSASYTHLPVHVFYLLACKPFKLPQPVLAGYTQQIAIAVLSLSIPLLTLRRPGGKRDPPDVLRRKESAILPNAANIPYLPQVNLCDKDHIN